MGFAQGMNEAVHTTNDTIRVALLGYGTIGSALHRVLVEHGEHIRHATGRKVEVVTALVRDAARHRAAGEAAGPIEFVESIDEVFAHDVALVCEAMGGLEPARTLLLDVLQRGIPVVTANKQLVAHHGGELFEAAERNDAQLRFEASVCGAIPIIRMLRESLAASRIERLLGILNGTTNYVLSLMSGSGASYEDALRKAGELGYAEPDPTDDVSGADAAAKLSLLAGIAFHTRVPIGEVRCTGITGVTAEDISFARMLGYRVKLIGRAERIGEQLSLDVTPMLIPEAHPLAAVSGSTNAVQVTGATFRELTIQGPGAGGPETASALAGDIVGVMGSTPSFLTRDPRIADCRIAAADARAERFYVRMRVPDRPGVLAFVAGRFADREISIERVLQQKGSAGSASLIVTTHPTTAPAVAGALQDDATIGGDTTVMPIMEGITE